jgi:hypothetical protein
MTAHHHASVKTVKSGTAAFVTPWIMDNVIKSEDVLKEWNSILLSLSEWNEKFSIASSALDDIPASTTAMEMIQEVFFPTEALNFKRSSQAKERFR